MRLGDRLPQLAGLREGETAPAKASACRRRRTAAFLAVGPLRRGRLRGAAAVDRDGDNTHEARRVHNAVAQGLGDLLDLRNGDLAQLLQRDTLVVDVLEGLVLREEPRVQGSMEQLDQVVLNDHDLVVAAVLIGLGGRGGGGNRCIARVTAPAIVCEASVSYFFTTLNFVLIIRM